MVYTVTVSPAIDYCVHCNGFETGVVNRSDGVEYVLPGGKGINVSIMLNRFGVESVALGFIAGFTGEEINRLTLSYGVHTNFKRVKGMSRINVKLKSDGTETEINGQGAIVSQEHVDALITFLSGTEEESWVVLAGNIPKYMPRNTYGEILRRLSEKRLKIVVDTTDELLRCTLAYHPYLIKPNVHELAEFFNAKIKTTEEVFLYAQKMQTLGARNVIVSMGAEGACLLCEDGKKLFVEAPKGKVVNSVGAGDSLVAGFITGSIKYPDDILHAFRLGVCAGSASTFSDKLARREEVLKLYEKMMDKK